MKPGIYIKENELEFVEYPSNEIGAARYCKSFKLKLNDIKFIALSPRLVVDDESLFLLIADAKGKIFPLPQYILGSDGLKKFESHFELKPIRDEWEKFGYIDHNGKYDKVIYPKKYYWKNLFEDDWKLKVRQLYSWGKPKSFFGTISKANFV